MRILIILWLQGNLHFPFTAYLLNCLVNCFHQFFCCCCCCFFIFQLGCLNLFSEILIFCKGIFITCIWIFVVKFSGYKRSLPPAPHFKSQIMLQVVVSIVGNYPETYENLDYTLGTRKPALPFHSLFTKLFGQLFLKFKRNSFKTFTIL